MNTMPARTQHLRGDFEKIYQLDFKRLSWYTHAGVTGVTSLNSEIVDNLCGVAYEITMECYELILYSIVDAFGIHKADEKIKDKIRVAKMLPFADTAAHSP